MCSSSSSLFDRLSSFCYHACVKHLNVEGMSVWQMPREGQNGTLTVTFKVRPFFHTISGNLISIYDSSVALVEETEGEKQSSFGFLLT